ncbi:MAG TPA: AraC family transcriptional regulator [Pyrinomonadaceae bacterium]|nr:AraC family transcriptional regulator [Pyrinomonadaceae bacterium]
MKDSSGRITFGEQLVQLDISGFVLTETFHEPSLVLPRHDHERANINFTIDGSFRETLGNHPQECESGSILVKPPGEAHGNKYNHKGAHCLVIELSPSRLDDVRAFTSLFDTPAHVKDGSLSLIMRHLYDELRAQSSGFELVIEGLILEMLGQTFRQNNLRDCSASPRWLAQAQELIHQHFAEKLSLHVIADAVQIHPSHLARTFRKHHRCSIGEYVRRLRIEYAARELLKSDASLTDISLAAGFSDQSHFTHEFKRQLRTTPAEYKRLHSRTSLTNTH